MKRTLHKRAGLWELSIPLRAPVRGIWRYGTFAEAWGYLWRTGYPPGVPVEVKMAARDADPSPPGAEHLADADDSPHDASDSPSGPHPVWAAALPADEPKPAPQGSPWRSRAVAVGLASGLTILLMILLWPLFHRSSAALPSVADSTAPKAASPTPKPAEVSPAVSGAGKSHASIRANDRSWITACVDGKVVFSKLFAAGSRDDIDFLDRAVVRMGDAGPVEITVDGKPVGSLGRTGQVRVIELVPGASHFLVGGEEGDCTFGKPR